MDLTTRHRCAGAKKLWQISALFSKKRKSSGIYLSFCCCLPVVNDKHYKHRSGINRKVSVFCITIIIIPGLCKFKTTMKKETKKRMGQMITELHQDGKNGSVLLSVVSEFGKSVYIKDGDDTNWTLGSLWTQTTK